MKIDLIKNTKQPNMTLRLLEKRDYWRLFQLKESDNVSYQAWNVATGEWGVTTDYKKAVDLCERRTEKL